MPIWGIDTLAEGEWAMYFIHRSVNCHVIKDKKGMWQWTAFIGNERWYDVAFKSEFDAVAAVKKEIDLHLDPPKSEYR